MLTGERGATEDGTEEEDEETEGATVNVVLFDDVSGLSDLIRLFIEGKLELVFSTPVEMIIDALALLSPDW